MFGIDELGRTEGCFVPAMGMREFFFFGLLGGGRDCLN